MSKEIINGLPKGIILQGKTYDYEIVRALGQGSFGITYLASVKIKGELGGIDATLYVAIKEFFMCEINGRDNTSVTNGSKVGLYNKYKLKFIKEAQNLGKLKHENIIKVIEAFEANNTVYYSMEFIEGGSLDEYINKKGCLSEEETLRFTKQMVSALSFMHSKYMLHLDLKPSNVMLRKGIAVLIDFGLSKQFDDNGNPESSTTIGGGTPGYAPLEQVNFHGDLKNGLPTAMDIYALGATMFKMLVGHKPPVASDILNDGFPKHELYANGVSDVVIQLIHHAMTPLRKDRIASTEIFHCELKKILAYQDEGTVIDVEVVQQALKKDESKDKEAVKEKITIPGQKKDDQEKSNKKLWLSLLGLVVIVTAILLLPKKKDLDISDQETVVPSIIENITETSTTDYQYTNSKGLSFTYSGDINHQKVPHGKGIGKYSNGTYKGDYTNGLRHGQGTFDTNDGKNHYTGSFANDLYSKGILTLSDGMYYEGTFNNGQPYNGTWHNQNRTVNCIVTNGK